MATRSTKPSAMTTSYAMQSILTDVVSAGTEAPLGYGLGYSIFYYYCASNAVLDTEQYIKLLSGDGIAPTEETIADGSYPLPMSSCARTLRRICLPDGSLRSCSPKTASAVFETPAMAHSDVIKGEALSGASLFLVCFLLSAWLYRGKRIFCRRFPQAAVLNMRIDHCGIDAGMA